ncbi:MAG: GGDEF domain-containing protein [Parcubacteria group bacterium]
MHKNEANNILALATLAGEQGKRSNDFLSAKENAWLVAKKKKIENELQDISKQVRLPEILKTDLKGEFAEDELTAAAGLLERFEESVDMDGLTHLENRRGLFKKGIEYFKAVENSSDKIRTISVVSMDIDFFKAYNEFSHTFGDIALQKVGQVLLECTKDSGFSARLGGEEIFILVEKQLSKQQIIDKALEIKNKINQALNEIFKDLDAQMNKPNATIDFLENAILTESRNRSEFNSEMIKKPEFKSAKAQAKKIKAFEFTNEIEPADFVLELKKAIKRRRVKKKNP